MDVTSKIFQIIEAANSSDTVQPMLRGWNRTVWLILDNNTFEITIVDGQAAMQSNALDEADISFTLEEETLDALIAEKITPLEAKMQGKIESSGNIVDILRFASILTVALKESRSSAIPQKEVTDGN